MAVYDINGYTVEGTYDQNIKSINHRGYKTVAPENTLPAYVLSKKMGFNYVETDVSFTKDGIPMLLHDASIDRTSNGTGNLIDLTYQEVRQYDFIYDNTRVYSAYAGTTIPTFEEFIFLCKSIMLHPYIELKQGGDYTQAQIELVVDMVKSCGMRGNVTYISFSDTFLQYVKNADTSARLGFLSSGYTHGTADIPKCNALKTNYNSVFYDVNYSRITPTMIQNFKNADIPIEAWTVNNASVVLGLDNYVTGITSDYVNAGKVYYDAYMNG